MQQQELAQMRQRDANLTALAAIGPRKKRKLDSPGGSAGSSEVGGVALQRALCSAHLFPFFLLLQLAKNFKTPDLQRVREETEMITEVIVRMLM